MENQKKNREDAEALERSLERQRKAEMDEQREDDDEIREQALRLELSKQHDMSVYFWKPKAEFDRDHALGKLISKTQASEQRMCELVAE